MKNVLLVMLEFDNWNQARAWSYTGAWAFQDGLEENGHRCTVLPAMWDISHKRRRGTESVTAFSPLRSKKEAQQWSYPSGGLIQEAFD